VRQCLGETAARSGEDLAHGARPRTWGHSPARSVTRGLVRRMPPSAAIPGLHHHSLGTSRLCGRDKPPRQGGRQFSLPGSLLPSALLDDETPRHASDGRFCGRGSSISGAVETEKDRQLALIKTPWFRNHRRDNRWPPRHPQGRRAMPRGTESPEESRLEEEILEPAGVSRPIS